MRCFHTYGAEAYGQNSKQTLERVVTRLLANRKYSVYALPPEKNSPSWRTVMLFLAIPSAAKTRSPPNDAPYTDAYRKAAVLCGTCAAELRPLLQILRFDR